MLKPQELVNEYAKISAEIKVLKKQHDKHRLKLIAYLKSNNCPTKGPYLIEMVDSERTQFSWQAFGKRVAKLAWGESAKSKIKAAIKKAGTEPVCTLLLKVNPDWKE